MQLILFQILAILEVKVLIFKVLIFIQKFWFLGIYDCYLSYRNKNNSNKYKIYYTKMDSAYLKEHVGKALTLGLAEISQKKPIDPIEYLSKWLRKHVENLKDEANVCNDLLH